MPVGRNTPQNPRASLPALAGVCVGVVPWVYVITMAFATTPPVVSIGLALLFWFALAVGYNLRIFLEPFESWKKNQAVR